MQFQNPLALLLLLALIPIYRIGKPSRGYGRGRERIALALRILIVLLLVLAAAGLELHSGSDSLAVVFLIDASDSVPPETRAAAESFVARAMETMREDDQAAVILFGAEALVDRAMSPGKELAPFRSNPDPSGTNVAGAVRLGMALFPPDSARRMVLLTDGVQTSGDALSAAQWLADSGVDFVVVPLSETSAEEEVTLLSVDLPQQLIAGETFDLRFTLHARTPAQAFVRIFSGGALAFEGAVQLEQGTRSFRIPLTAGEPGFTPFTVQIGSTRDTHFQNNEMAAYSRVQGPPRILLVAPEPGEPLPFTEETRPDEYSRLLSALEAAGFTVDLARPEGLPFELVRLGEYASVVMVDVPARQLTGRQMEALQNYVRELGGGLLTIGGPTSYGVGGYFRTPLEEILPVEMDIKDQERRPNLAMVFVIDRSGSMGDTSGGITKLALAKEAAARSVELLFPGDKVGVVAFDEGSTWVVPITTLENPEDVVRAIESIGVGGGTDILAGLQAMADELPEDDSTVRHVILLTDGGADPAGIPQLVEQLYRESGITLTTVGVGPDAAAFLEDLARIGGGRYHFTDRPESIPNIFTEETTLATRSYIVEEPFFPRLAAFSPILGQVSEVPLLYGYVATSAKATAQSILVSELNDPILAAWQYGLGKAIAWTSDASARWARDWVGWEQYPSFWAQVVRYTVSDQERSPLQARIDQQNGRAVLTVEAVSAEGEYLNGYEMLANIVHPEGEISSLLLSQSAPGQYRGSFFPAQEGAYLVRLDGVDERGENGVSTLTGWVRAYSPEYRLIEDQTNLIPALTGVTGAAQAALDAPRVVFANPVMRASTAAPLWPFLLTTALLLFPFDIGVRRLAFDRRDFARAYRRLSSALTRQPVAAGSTARSENLASLLQAKDRVDERQTAKTTAPIPSPAERPAAVPEPAEAGKAPAENAQTKSAGQATSPDRPGEETSTTAALLARKRARERQRNDDSD